MNKFALIAASANAMKFNSAVPTAPQMLSQFEEEATKPFVNYTNMTIAELDEEFDKAEKDFDDAFKAASDKLNKTQKYDEAEIVALVKSEVKLTTLIEGYRSNLAAQGIIEDKKLSISDLSNKTASEPLTKYVSALKNAQATVPSQRSIYDLVHADMMQEHMNETAPKVPEATSDAAFSLQDFADKFCNFDTEECHELTKVAAQKEELDKTSAYIKRLNQRAKSAQLWSTYQKELEAQGAIKAKKKKKDKKKKAKKDAKKDGDKKDAKEEKKEKKKDNKPKDDKKVEKKDEKAKEPKDQKKFEVKEQKA